MTKIEQRKFEVARTLNKRKIIFLYYCRKLNSEQNAILFLDFHQKLTMSILVIKPKTDDDPKKSKKFFFNKIVIL